MNLKKISLTAVLTFVVVFSFAQITVVTADKGPASNGDGLYYSLPATLFKVEVELKKTERLPGPLADYCQNYLGTTQYIKEVSTDFSVVDEDVRLLTIADENASYYIAFSAKSSKEDKSPVIELTPFGTLKAVNIDQDEQEMQREVNIEENKTIILGDDANRFRYEAQYNRKKKIDTVIRKITIDTMTINKFLFKTSWVDKSNEERAEEAAQQIRSIRESRLNLLTGYHEVNFGESLLYMDNQLQKLEQQYLELFLGKERVTIEHHTFYVLPENETLNQDLLATDNGKKLVFKVSPQTEMQIKPMAATVSNVIYYRIPAQATVSLIFNGKELFKDIYPVSQLGVVTGVSVSKAGVAFNPVTGVPNKVVKY